MDTLQTAVAAWHGAAALTRSSFRDRLLPPDTDNATVDLLRNAASGLVEARTRSQLSAAGKDLALAAQNIGVGAWQRFVGDAASRAANAPTGAGGPSGATMRPIESKFIETRPPVQRVAAEDDAEIEAISTQLRQIVKDISIQADLLPPTNSASVMGTRLHALFAGEVRARNIPGVTAEQSFITGGEAYYGELGSIRTDVVLRGNDGRVKAVWDYKTGRSTTMSQSRVDDIRDAIGRDYGDVPIFILLTQIDLVVQR